MMNGIIGRKVADEGETMSRKKISRNAPCPCGSGKKYKHCCYGKTVDFEEDDAGNVFESLPMPEEAADMFQAPLRKFDPVFFDMPHPEHLEQMMVEGMKAARIDPAIIYAYEKTGRLVAEGQLRKGGLETRESLDQCTNLQTPAVHLDQPTLEASQVSTT